MACGYASARDNPFRNTKLGPLIGSISVPSSLGLLHYDSGSYITLGLGLITKEHFLT